MGVNFTDEKQKRLKYLLVMLIVLIVVALFVFSRNFFVKEPPISSGIGFTMERININFDVLKDPLLQKLQTFEEIPYPEEMEIGRENPFVPY